MTQKGNNIFPENCSFYLEKIHLIHTKLITLISNWFYWTGKTMTHKSNLTPITHHNLALKLLNFIPKNTTFYTKMISLISNWFLLMSLYTFGFNHCPIALVTYMTIMGDIRSCFKGSWGRLSRFSSSLSHLTLSYSLLSLSFTSHHLSSTVCNLMLLP